MRSERSPIAAPADERMLDLGGGVGAVIKVRGAQTAGRLAVVEHPFEPGALIEPHTHALEDEWTYVLSGEVAVQLGDEIFDLGTGAQIYKPRAIEHSVWNASAHPARLLEVILPAGFEEFFEETVGLVGSDGSLDEEALAQLAERYAVSMAFEKAPDLIRKHGLKSPVGRSS